MVQIHTSVTLLRHVISSASTPLTFLLSHTFREVSSRDISSRNAMIVCPRPQVLTRGYDIWTVMVMLQVKSIIDSSLSETLVITYQTARCRK